MILIINSSKEKLHYYEFVKPIEDILKKNRVAFFTRKYKEVNEKDLREAGKVIICGTSLKDFDYSRNIDRFEWIKDFDRPILGICAGMQIISLMFGGKMKKETEIGLHKKNFVREFLGINGEREVYHLHNNYSTLPENFESFTDGEIPQAIKHRTKPIYGVLFHPEVRNKEMIEEFCKL